MSVQPAENTYLYTDKEFEVEVWLKRLELQFPQSIGNKAYKLKYNLKEASRQGCKTILTFGGAYSNHIAAVAAMGKEEGFNTIGVIRGEELGSDIEKTLRTNPTLGRAKEEGMLFEFISRSAYREKHTLAFRQQIQARYDKVYILPEGGTNALAVKGCEEILTEADTDFEVIACAVGTGGTLSGVINSATPTQRVLGFSALKADMNSAIAPYVYRDNWQVFPEEYFGGFAKINPELISFINAFKAEYGVILDPIYTSKMMFALKRKIKSGYFERKTRILAVHTGGLQSIAGMNKQLKNKGLPLIKCQKS